MEIYVDTDAITEGSLSVAKCINNIESCINFITKKIKVAGEEFSSINYDRTSDAVVSATNALNSMSEKLAMVKEYLKNLLEIVDVYYKLKF